MANRIKSSLVTLVASLALALSSCSQQTKQKPSYNNHLFIKEGSLYLYAQDYAPISYASVTLPGNKVAKLHEEDRKHPISRLEEKVTDKLLEGNYSIKVVNENGDIRISSYELSTTLKQLPEKKSAWHAPAF